MQPEPLDDLDRLYARLQWADPKPNLTDRVLARIRRAQRIQHISTLATLVTLLALGLFAYALGRGLTFSGTLDFLEALVSNLDLLTDEADDFLSALVDALPLLEIAAVLGGAACVWLASHALPRLLTRQQGKAG
ncbi:MAG: hypothetical protein HY259_06885 [Chloroflexi bacterium]|nr:hypothetical protein [Chloroflexota bacterium]MBI3733169.1 hypothetical protein [Chloroflexota bacterium]